jgi:hypothetical protein
MNRRTAEPQNIARTVSSGSAVLRFCGFLGLLFVCLLSLPPARLAAASDLLPDLQMAALRDIRLEQTSDGRRLLRFTAEIINLGVGPFEIEGERASTADELMTNVRQRVFDTMGGSREITTTAVMHFADDGHHHWHVNNLERYELAALDGAGTPSIGAKASFCFFDNHHYAPSTPGSPGTIQYPACGTRQSLAVQMGLSVGWGDIYFWNLPDQYIDVTSLPAGRYRLTAIADPDNWFVELNDTNNSISVDLVIGAQVAFAEQSRLFFCQVML